MLPIHHPDETPLYRHVYRTERRRHHPGGFHPGDQQSIGNIEVADQPRRDRSPARLDAAAAIQQEHRNALARKIGGRRRTGRATADHHHIEGF